MIRQLMEANQEIDRLVDHWKELGAKMSKSELRDSIGHELEMLEYSPAHIKAVLPQIIARVQGE